jgi:hypothetical protein
MRLEVISELKKTDSPVCVFEDKGKRRFIKINEDSMIESYRNMTPEQLKDLIFSKKNVGVIDFINNIKLTEEFATDDGQSVTVKNKTMMFLPDFMKERELIYIFGPSGSGKSYLTRAYIEEFKRGRPDYDIFLFSRITEDPSLEGIDYIPIELTADKLRDIDVETLENSLVIFDDTDTPNDKEVTNLINNLKDLIAQEGRHYNISAIITTHMACNYNKTRIILNECQKYVIFPKGNGVKQMENMFCKYGGLNKNQFEKVRKLDTRWCMLNTSYPNYIVHQKGVYLAGAR